MTDEYYMVEFVGVNSPSILERIFNTRIEAVVYKSEHELGKFAAVITTTYLNIYRIYLQEILNVLGEQPHKRNPRGFMGGCVYNKSEPEPWESSRCVIGQHLFNHNIKLPFDPSKENPAAEALLQEIFFNGSIPEEILEALAATARKVQIIADGPADEKPKLWSEIIPEVVEAMEGRN